jgi:hypothetical protein
MNDSQGDQGPDPIQDDDAKSGRISLTIALCIWAVLLVTAVAFGLYWINRVAFFFGLIVLIPLVKLVPIVAALGVYFGFKGLEAEDERDARIGFALNAAAFVVGALFFFS